MNRFALVTRRIIIVVGLALTSLAALADEPKEEDLHIAPQPLSTALREFSEQTGLQVGYASELAEGKSTDGVEGIDDPDLALDTLLAQSGLTHTFVNEQTVVIQAAEMAASDDAGGDSDLGNGPTAGATPIVMAQNRTGVQQSQARQADEQESDREKRPLEEIVVTGTRIKGVKDQFSPVTQMSREEMDLAGFDNVSDIFDSLPQNFGGGVALDTGTGASPAGVGSVGINLRGLGNEATLVLLNGRRLAPGGGFGSFVDISAIPASAIDRVEVLTDGASAIYGSDAIAGVVNIILRDDFEGAESRLKLSTVTDGGGNTIKAAQTVGVNKDRANGLVSYEYSLEDELDANDRGFAESLPDPSYLLPFNRKHSVFTSGGVELSDRLSLTADGFYNDRKSRFAQTSEGITFTQNFQEVDAEQYGGAGSINVRLPGSWEGDLNASYSRSDFKADQSALHSTPGSGTVFLSDTEIVSVDASIGGPVFNLTDESARVVIGGHYRSEGADIQRLDRLTGDTRFEVSNQRDVFAVFGEVYTPLVSEMNAIPGVKRLAVTTAARFEDYSDVGSSFDPKFGLVWSPLADLHFRATYSTSFRAPRLDQLVDDLSTVILGVYDDPSTPSGTSVAIDLQGTTSELDPEEAESWTIGFDFSPAQLQGLKLRGTYFNVNYDGRIASPTLRFAPGTFHFTDFTGLPIRNLGGETVQSFVDRAARFFDFSDFFPVLGDLMLEDVTVILDRRPQNTVASQVEGIDLVLDYRQPSEFGVWKFSFNSTLLTTFEQQFSPVTPVDDLLGTFGNPIDLRLRAGVTWSTTSVNAALFVNHVGDYTDDQANNGPTPIDAWTTFDTTAQFNLGEIFGGGTAERAFLSLNVTNMFNEDPPSIGSRAFGTPIFDSANANPLGRQVGLLLTKRW